eukprot:7251136-Prymnesium_polylepis.1
MQADSGTCLWRSMEFDPKHPSAAIEAAMGMVMTKQIINALQDLLVRALELNNIKVDMLRYGYIGYLMGIPALLQKALLPPPSDEDPDMPDAASAAESSAPSSTGKMSLLQALHGQWTEQQEHARRIADANKSRQTGDKLDEILEFIKARVNVASLEGALCACAKVTKSPDDISHLASKVAKCLWEMSPILCNNDLLNALDPPWVLAGIASDGVGSVMLDMRRGVKLSRLRYEHFLTARVDAVIPDNIAELGMSYPFDAFGRVGEYGVVIDGKRQPCRWNTADKRAIEEWALRLADACRVSFDLVMGVVIGRTNQFPLAGGYRDYQVANARGQVGDVANGKFVPILSRKSDSGQTLEDAGKTNIVNSQKIYHGPNGSCAKVASSAISVENGPLSADKPCPEWVDLRNKRVGLMDEFSQYHRICHERACVLVPHALPDPRKLRNLNQNPGAPAKYGLSTVWIAANLMHIFTYTPQELKRLTCLFGRGFVKGWVYSHMVSGDPQRIARVDPDVRKKFEQLGPEGLAPMDPLFDETNLE